MLLASAAPPLSRQAIEPLAGFTDVDGLSEFDTDAAIDEDDDE